MKRGIAPVALAMAVLTAASKDSPSALAAPTLRTVYVTVTDSKGAQVGDLTAADFVVKEGGKEREIVKAEPAKARIRLAVMVEERLAPDWSVRTGLFEFIKRMQPSAEISLIRVGLRNTTIVDYTTSANALVEALNQLSLNPQPTSNLTEGILEIARQITQQKPERPVVVAVASSGGQAGGASAHQVLNELRQSGATLHSVTLAGYEGASTAQLGTMGDESGREQVLGDGPKQSGGRRVDVPATSGVPKALLQIADDLFSQYAITYALPDGVKPDRRFNVSVKRRGVSLRAPAAIPDRMF